MSVVSGADLPRGLDRFGIDPHCRLYVRPCALSRAAAGPASRPLVGGDLAFAECEVMIRDGAHISAVRASIPVLEDWAKAEGGAVEAHVLGLLEQLSARRAAFAGIALDAPVLMGVVNVTPDSFSDGGCYMDPTTAISHAEALLAAGAGIIDVGGESTRPGAAAVPESEELRRILPVIAALAAAGACVSVDSRHGPVMEAALGAGARIVNDVAALTGDGGGLRAVRKAGAGVVLMHMQGEPRSMQTAPEYRCAPLDIYDYLETRIQACLDGGLTRAQIAIDPGIGFGKSVAHNAQILSSLALFHGLGCALVLGVSRKSFIAKISRGEAPDARLPGSLAAGLAGIERGVHILRVHDVEATAQALAVHRAIGLA